MLRPSMRRTLGRIRGLEAADPARPLLAVALALFVFGLVLLALGHDPIGALSEALRQTLFSAAGLSEVGVLMIPLTLTALATAVPARVGLVNVGGEGQLFAGAWAGAAVALHFGVSQSWLMLAVMAVAACVGGGLWAGAAALLRQYRGVNEIITTLLLNYVAILLVNVFVFGPWKDPEGFGYPYTPDFSAAAIFPAIADSRFHWGVMLPVLAVTVCFLLIYRTRWGFNMRAVGGNADAARRSGIPVARYLAIAMIAGGGLAGLAGMAEVSGIQHHLRPGISANLGYLGFLASWLAGHNPVTIVAACFLLALVLVAGDILQLTAGLPSAAGLVLAALVLVFVLGLRRPGGIFPGASTGVFR